MVEDQGIIKVDQQVLIRMPSDMIRVVQMQADEVINLGRFGSFKTNELIGKHFGYTYKINADQSVTPIKPNEFATEEADGLGVEQTTEGYKISFEGEQQMSMDEIEKLKQSGVQGDEIIRRIQEGHAAFDIKTEYSKEKYLKRKKSKYLQQFTPSAITVSELMDLFISKDPGRVLNMGIETLALALNYANIQPGGHYLVLDETPGIFATAILERGGEVTIVHESEHPNVDSFRYVEIDESKVHCISLLDLLHPEECEPLLESKTEEELLEMKPSTRGQYHRRKAREERRTEILDYAHSKGYDGLILASTLALPDLLQSLLKFVGGSRSVVVYTEHKEPLVDLALFLRDEKRLLAPTMMEARVRKFQTLPGRIHPLMSSRGYGGYLLYATRVYPDADVQGVGKHNTNRKRQKLNPSETKSA